MKLGVYLGPALAVLETIIRLAPDMVFVRFLLTSKGYLETSIGSFDCCTGIPFRQGTRAYA